MTSTLKHPEEVDRHIEKELKAGRIAGPFKEPPFVKFQSSPIGLVEKKEKGSFRMIQNLSYPLGCSINDQIDADYASVRYSTIQEAVNLVDKVGPGAYMSKTDVKNAFRVVPLHPDVHNLFVFHWKGLFYYDLTLPMGCSASCQLFERVSTAVQWIANTKLRCNMVHYLDDFFLASVSEEVGKRQLDLFLNMCQDIGLGYMILSHKMVLKYDIQNYLRSTLSLSLVNHKIAQ